MALYTIADPHLPLGAGKPMDIFSGWNDYVRRFEDNWRRLIGENDTVVLPGDISWAMKLADAEKDLAFLDSLPGRKIIGKGNHDYWWETMNKMNGFLREKGFGSIEFLFNNAFLCEGAAVCGARGWFFDDKAENAEKIIAREAGRLRMSIQAAKALDGEPVVFMHYPVVYEDKVIEPIYGVIKEYGIRRVYFGHIHGTKNPALTSFTYGETEFSLISADYLGFMPKRVFL